MLAAAALLIGALAIPTLAADSPSASDPSIVHEPQLTAFEGRSIPISLIASCGQGAECAAALYWRATPRESEPAESWSRASLEQGGRTTAPAVGEDAVEWGGEIPAADVGTRGVDYFIEVAEDDQLGHLPLDGSDGTVGSYFHVRTLSPPLATHIPAAFAQVDRPLELQINSSCSTAECTAKIFYRTTDGPLSDEPVVTDPDWDSVTMDQSGEPVSLGEAGELAAYSGEIPAEAVDTRGVDYFIRVSDGTVKTYLPGTSYQGYYLPTDGKRIGYVHVHGLEPPQIVHEPVAASPYREPVRVKATSNCPATRECSAELYWRTTDKDVIETTGSDFESAPMEVRRVGEGTLPPDLPIGEDNEVIEVVGEIPAAAADTRGLDYFFSISDGSTTSWWPGTSSVDGYVPVQGTRVGYEHVRVLDPPHLIPHPLAATPALSAYEVTANLTCATESCEVTLHYNDDPRATDVASADPGRWQSMPMQPGPIAGLEQLETPLGVASTYAATIPAEEVTTRGLAYYIEVFDGYVHAYAPGSEYQGAYVPADGTRGDQISGDGTSVGLTFQGEDVISGDGGITGPDLAFPVRVLEPPHVVHVPPAAPQRAVATAIEARSNCATPECRARLHWRLPNGQWESERMSGGLDSSVSGDQALWSYEGELPAAATDVAVAAYRISVHDGYATESSPTYTVATSSVEDTDTGPLPRLSESS